MFSIQLTLFPAGYSLVIKQSQCQTIVQFIRVKSSEFFKPHSELNKPRRFILINKLILMKKLFITPMLGLVYSGAFAQMSTFLANGNARIRTANPR